MFMGFMSAYFPDSMVCPHWANTCVGLTLLAQSVCQTHSTCVFG